MVANPLAPHWLDASVDDNALISGIWSSNTFRNPSGEIEVAGITASALASEFGTPVFVVDEAHALIISIRFSKALLIVWRSVYSNVPPTGMP